MESKAGEFKVKVTARAIANPKRGSGLIRELHGRVEQLDSEAQACKQSKLGDADSHVLRILEDVPHILPDVNSEEELSESDEDSDDWNLTDLRWISSPLPLGEIHTSLRGRRVSGTCEWLLSREDFGSWETSGVSAVFSLTGSCKYLPLQIVPEMVVTCENG